MLDEQRRWQSRVFDLIRQLPPEDQQRYRALEARCKEILEHQGRSVAMSSGLEEQGMGSDACRGFTFASFSRESRSEK
jgi:hypothetical protein